MKSSEKRPRTVEQLLHNFAQCTSMHGVPRVINARSLPVRILWATISSAAFVLFFWQTSTLLQRYWTYPKKVNMEIIQKPVPFPSVSVCNTDHLDLEVVEKISEFFGLTTSNASSWRANSSEKAWLEEFSSAYDEYVSKAMPFSMLYGKLWPTHNKEMLQFNSRIGLVANVGPRTAAKAGVKLNEFVISCQFLNEDCNLSTSFVETFDPYYFNCYTFSPEAVLPSRSSRLHGVEFGLSLILFSGSAGQLPIDDDTILPGMVETNNALTSGRGARVIVHPPGTRPYPTAEGFDVAPGFSINIGVKARENQRVGLPHGNCSAAEASEGEFAYTLIECQHACIQRKMETECGCVDKPHMANNPSTPHCFQLTTFSEACISATTDFSKYPV